MTRRKDAEPEPVEPTPEAADDAQMMRMVIMAPKVTHEILELLSQALNATKSSVVHQALFSFAAQCKHLEFAAKVREILKGEG